MTEDDKTSDYIDDQDPREPEQAFLTRMTALSLRETDSGYLMVEDADLGRLTKIAQRYRRMDGEAAQHVESVICMRSQNFTGEPPYVGWKGLGLALNEDYNELAELRERIVEIESEGRERGEKL